MVDYKSKYLKYKLKYVNNKILQEGGVPKIPQPPPIRQHDSNPQPGSVPPQEETEKLIQFINDLHKLNWNRGTTKDAFRTKFNTVYSAFEQLKIIKPTYLMTKKILDNFNTINTQLQKATPDIDIINGCLKDLKEEIRQDQ